jgi:hypothetical protein
MRLAKNVAAYTPEADLSKIKPENLVDKGWSEELVEFFRRNQFGSSNLREFERNQAQSKPPKRP